MCQFAVPDKLTVNKNNISQNNRSEEENGRHRLTTHFIRRMQCEQSKLQLKNELA